ncbi:type IV conjugative transfer system coupling protein TraD [Pectobacterium versatile]|uniref:type IV conjugative transfer system coupling protein TraD n=1 Tax=Pectobacterium TaxID=122277 RepID=UPI000EAF28AD|nr:MULTISPECIES: type IV conjugative transfer system coupling protein TraD [Pectobacterium]MBI0472763.1 type IV conjugative transfer system coupling protein TraD [Pectobacterium parmentieri]MBI0495356.1 type IV conjugative transfer system coupling protein TraD [Pectobacterium parmentieri]MBI0569886.1 type IV conjugative transfer system coupling protein TraD [Pectobacterium parmentieri]MBI0574603.1 type IV conjugative transfer system coupling protein TraD [Pectobacterium parmentieri]MCQ8232915.
MSDRYVMESLLRPAVELYTATTAWSATYICLTAPWAVALAPSVSWVTAAGFGVLALKRTRQGLQILRYRRNIRRLPRYVMSSKQIPVSNRYLFLGRGFQWTQKHTQRLLEARRPETECYVQPSVIYRMARDLEKKLEYSLPYLCRLTQSDTVFNPVRPLPPVGGSPIYHGVEPDESDIGYDLGERVGHSLVMGTTRVGKTRLAELLITQDIRRGDVTIVFDPKGDADLLKRMWAEARRAGRESEFHVFHLGWPDISARYNAIGRFSRISEVASRVAGQLSSEGNSAAFKEFAWRFVNIITRALVALGQRPDYSLILRYVTNIGDLYETYVENLLSTQAPQLWVTVENLISSGMLNERDLPRNMQGQANAMKVWAIETVLGSDEGKKIWDPVLDGLRSAVRYDRTYFDKIVASLLPLLEKLTTGKTAALLAPDYTDMDDPRPIFDWQEVIRKRGIVYVGLDALSDAEVASAVGNSMFADLVSVAGYIYKFGIGGEAPQKKIPINLHCDEFNELMGEEFIPLINKGGGAGIQVTAYTQTLSDIEARIGSSAKANQVIGNFNSLIMLRVRENSTAELLTSQLPEVDVYTKTLVSGVTDITNPDQGSDFTSNVQDRVSNVRMPMITPADIINLPKGQAFALLEGGRLWKIRMPLPDSANDPFMPESISRIAEYMQQNYRTGETWWTGSTLPSDSLTGSAFEPKDEVA